MLSSNYQKAFWGVIAGVFALCSSHLIVRGEVSVVTIDQAYSSFYSSFSGEQNLRPNVVLANFEEESESGTILHDDDIPSRIDYVSPEEFGNWDLGKDGSGRTKKKVLSPGGTIQKLTIQVLAPHHPKNKPAPTLNSSPILYWYVQADIDFPVEFRLRDEKTNKTVKKIVISPKTHRGMHEISLKKNEYALQAGVNYRWSVYGNSDPLEPDNNPYSQVAIRMNKESQDTVFEGLEGKPDGEKAKANFNKALQFGKDGYWYDAFMILDDLVKTYPGNCKLVKLRSSLLEKPEVNLGFVAKTLNEQAGCS